MLLNTSTDAVLMQVTDCYSEPHMFVEVSELQPWVILSLNAGALKTTGETDPSFVSSRLPLLGKSVRLLCDMEQPSQALGNPALVIQSFLRPQKRVQWRAMTMPFSLSLSRQSWQIPMEHPLHQHHHYAAGLEGQDVVDKKFWDIFERMSSSNGQVSPPSCRAQPLMSSIAVRACCYHGRRTASSVKPSDRVLQPPTPGTTHSRKVTFRE